MLLVLKSLDCHITAGRMATPTPSTDPLPTFCNFLLSCPRQCGSLNCLCCVVRVHIFAVSDSYNLLLDPCHLGVQCTCMYTAAVFFLLQFLHWGVVLPKARYILTSEDFFSLTFWKYPSLPSAHGNAGFDNLWLRRSPTFYGRCVNILWLLTFPMVELPFYG